MKLSIESGALSILTAVSDGLSKRRVKAYLVGGFIRDALLEMPTADIDIALAADALKTAPRIADALGGRFVLLDKQNRIGRVVVTDEKAPSEGRWQLDFTTFDDSIEQDLSRRDFTVDAIALDLENVGRGDLTLIDPFGGLGDLKNRVIRAVSETVFADDAVRLLRAVRLAAELGFSLDKNTEALVKSQCHLITDVAGERLREELVRLLAVANPEKFLFHLDELGLITALFPELAKTKGVEQPREHSWNVFDHSLQTVIATDFILHQGSWPYASDKVLAAVPWSEELAGHFNQEVSGGSHRRALLKLAALLHDIAKPETKAVGEDGRTHFLGHDKLGGAAAAAVLERLRFSGKEVKLVETVIKYHMRPGQMSQQGLPTPRAIYRYFRDTGEAGIDILYLSLADHLATRGPKLDMAGWREHTRMVEYVLEKHFEQQRLVEPVKLVDGNDLINIFGLEPGPAIGEILEAVREAQASGELNDRQQALDYIRQRLATEKTLC
ncbi:MAG: HD domain-containing protein [Dehalococcoidia bacterium]|jgi:poly(A) polymerase